MPPSETNRAAAAIWKIESPRIIASLTRLVRDVGLAEDLAQDAFVDALVRWERGGIPDKPGAWLMTAARHFAIDAVRRTRRIQASRARARVGAGGQAVLLEDQDRSEWDAVLVRRGLAGLARADALVGERPGPYFLEAAIAACHARARAPADTDWARIAALYEALAQIAPSPIVELNRAVAQARVFGAEVGLRILDALADEPSLRDYPFLPSVRADLLSRLDRFEEAMLEIERAIALTKNVSEGAKLAERAAAYRAASARRRV